MLCQAKYKMKPPMSARLMPGHPLAEGLVGFWPMLRKSSTQVFDLSGNGSHGAFVGNPLWVAGTAGPAIDFSDDAIDCGDNVYNQCTTALTIIFKGTAGSGGNSYGRIVDKYPGPSIYRNTTDSTMRFYGTIGGLSKDLPWTGSSWSVGETATWAFVLDPNNQMCYKNGVLASNVLSGGPFSGAYDDGGAVNFYIGNRASDMARDFDGLIEYVYIYNRALNPSEIAQLYREPFCMFDWEWLPGRVAANGDVLVTPDPASAVAAKVDPTVDLGSVTVSPSPASAVAASGWIGISSVHLDSDSGDNGMNTIEEGLDGDDHWQSDDEQTHWFVVDLGDTYNVQKVRGRSLSIWDPTDVNIYVNDTGLAPWGDAVASGIDTWQDNPGTPPDWVEVDNTNKNGRYVKVEIEATEYGVGGKLGFGGPSANKFSIFDVYTSFDPTVVIGDVIISPTPASAVAATVAPTVEYGSVTIEPAEASAIAAAVDPTVNLGESNITPSPAYAVAAAVDPTVVLGSQTIEPTPAAVVAISVGPYFADEGNAILFGANF